MDNDVRVGQAISEFRLFRKIGKGSRKCGLTSGAQSLVLNRCFMVRNNASSLFTAQHRCCAFWDRDVVATEAVVLAFSRIQIFTPNNSQSNKDCEKQQSAAPPFAVLATSLWFHCAKQNDFSSRVFFLHRRRLPVLSLCRLVQFLLRTDDEYPSKKRGIRWSF
jgi:hypothetical protein